MILKKYRFSIEYFHHSVYILPLHIVSHSLLA